MSDSEPGLFNFTSVPDGYRHYLQPAVFDPWARELLAFVPPSLGDVVLDVAAGTGAVAHSAAPIVGPGGRVIASDVSPLMLAEVRLEATDDRAAVEPLESPADHLAVPDGVVDAVYCQQGLQFMSDRHAVITEMLRVLRPVALSGSPSGPTRVRQSPSPPTLGSSRTTAFPSHIRTHTTPRSSPCRRVRSKICSRRWLPN
jgi:ubiquinone/menaquinone biosynthesis C-methylase UbiE